MSTSKGKTWLWAAMAAVAIGVPAAGFLDGDPSRHFRTSSAAVAAPAPALPAAALPVAPDGATVGGAPGFVMGPPTELSDMASPPSLALRQDQGDPDPELSRELARIERDRTMIQQLHRLAKAKADLCTTGFGPPDLCVQRAGAGQAGSGQQAAAAQTDGPPAGVIRIAVVEGKARATLVVGGGRTITVDGASLSRTPSVLPDGSRVVAIDAAGRKVEVLDPAGRRVQLPWVR
ncbi:hypothetical protein JJL56_28020 [Azospirillum sp. YIM DDC1]|uniref:Type IV pilus biogenesis protein PilP n=1 Tax=Azospirillum aestuarii TaxID=2802052 RepID=A0ABS1I7P9_9PROT|nr:hypothetical protein [Azospirillum aestuarii]MBK4722708.1 hypothetical protein [Azospirillum aestuarii]